MISTVNETFAFLFALEIIPALPRIPNLTMSLERGRRRGFGPFLLWAWIPHIWERALLLKKKTSFSSLVVCCCPHTLQVRDNTHTPRSPLQKTGIIPDEKKKEFASLLNLDSQKFEGETAKSLFLTPPPPPPPSGRWTSEDGFGLGKKVKKRQCCHQTAFSFVF